MQRIQISNFAAINSLELDLDDKLDIIIGAQASGKSTLSKTIYFCRKVRDYLLDYLTNPDNFKTVHPNEYYAYFLKYVRKQFMGCFGTTKHMPPFCIDFYYEYSEASSKCKKLSLQLDDTGYVKVFFSKNITNRIKKLINEASSLFNQNSSATDEKILENLINDLKMRQIVRKHFLVAVEDLFSDYQEILYIPAGRSILSTLSEQLHDLDVSIMDLPLQEFIELIQGTKKRFGTKIPEIVSNYTKTVDGQIKNADVNLAYKLIRTILRGEYVNETDGEKLYYSENQWVKLMYASSGQQEVLWILLLIFIRILETRKVFLVVEEPEAHLFTSAQKQVLELIALLINSTGSQVIITTHSPYILTATNLLAYSGKIEGNAKNLSEEIIIPRQTRIDPNTMQAYLISNHNEFSFRSIKDPEELLIDPSYIDEVSTLINNATDRIMDLEIKYGM